MIKAFALLLCCSFASAINNGRPATTQEVTGKYGFVAYVEVASNNGITRMPCVGTLVKNNRVLTAAPCFCFETDRINVYIHTLEVRKGRRSAGRLLKKKNYNCAGHSFNQASEYFAIIELNKAFGNVKPVELDCGDRRYIGVGEAVTFLGYGSGESTGPLMIGQGEVSTCEAGMGRSICVDVSDHNKPSVNRYDAGCPLLVNRNGKQAGISMGSIAFEKGNNKGRKLNQWADVGAFCHFILN